MKMLYVADAGPKLKPYRSSDNGTCLLASKLQLGYQQQPGKQDNHSPQHCVLNYWALTSRQAIRVHTVQAMACTHRCPDHPPCQHPQPQCSSGYHTSQHRAHRPAG